MSEKNPKDAKKIVNDANKGKSSDELSEEDLEEVAGGGADKSFTSFKCVTYPASSGGTC